MALEAEVVLLVLVDLREVVPVHATAPLDGANDEALAIAKALNGRRCELERRLNQVDRIEVLRLNVVLQIPDVYIPILMSRD